MTAPALTHRERRRHWCTAAAMTTWSSLAHSVIMRCLRSSCMFCTPCLAVFPTHKSTGFKSGEVGGHKYRQNEFWRFSPSFFNDVTITSSFRSVVQVLMGNFYKFSVSRTVRMTCLRGELPLSAEAVRKFGPMHIPIATKCYELTRTSLWLLRTAKE